MASQFRSNWVTTVDGLVCLGQQLKKKRKTSYYKNNGKKTWKPRVSHPASVQLRTPLSASAPAPDVFKNPSVGSVKALILQLHVLRMVLVKN